MIESVDEPTEKLKDKPAEKLKDKPVVGKTKTAWAQRLRA